MGICNSQEGNMSPEEMKAVREAKIKSKWIDEQLNTDVTYDREAIKLLFLGSGESGKSTMLKQMKIIHNKDSEPAFTQEDRLFYASLIHSNIVQSTKTLCRQATQFAAQNKLTVQMQQKNSELVRVIDDLKFDEKIKPDLAEGIKLLWADPAIRETYKQRSLFQLNDSTEYFYARIDEVVRDGYLPTDQDILRARIRTTGIVEHKVVIQNNEFRMYDVGGQRNARKKWIHCFENVTSVIFVAALSDYNLLLYEDGKTNRMHEALNLFEDILKSEWFQQTAMILFLNKKDIFREKILENPLTVCFPEYNGQQTNYRSCCKFIKEQFKARNKNSERKIYTHYTNATDSKAFKAVFDSVQQIILRVHLIDVGLLDPTTDVDGDKLVEEDFGDRQEFEEEHKGA